ncbi:MAG TPA: flagellar hook-basal body complex protein [Lacunisphaera sp.]|jgi:flagellar hook protein FlgE
MSLIGTLGSGVSALQSFMKGLDVIGNNIANVNTTGFKSSSAQYVDSFSNVLQGSAPGVPPASNTPTVAIGTGVRLGSIHTDYSQGSLETTGSGTDLGISGEGYFHVQNPVDGTEYATRDGSFRWDDKGNLVNSQGYSVMGLTGAGLATVGPIKLGTPPTGTQLQSVTIDKSGNVVEFYSDGTSATTNQVQLQKFTDQSALVPEGNNLYSGLLAAGPIGAASGTTAFQAGGVNAPGANGLGDIQSGTLELSNVDLTSQFANLITTQRSFQAGARLITVSDSILDDVVNLKRS